jgi:hypothetical protein
VHVFCVRGALRAVGTGAGKVVQGVGKGTGQVIGGGECDGALVVSSKQHLAA